jgi:hypothetical protein
MRAIGFAATALVTASIFSPATFGQATQEREFHLIHPASVQAFQEIANGVRIVTEIQDLTTDNAQMSMTVRGSAEQVGLAEWLVKQLDQPAGAVVLPVPPEYKGLAESDGAGRGQPTKNGIARVFYLPHTATVQDFQEAVNAARTVTEVRRVFTYNDGKAVLARGTPEQMAMLEWTLNELDQASTASPAARSGAHEYGAGSNDVLRVAYLPNTKTVQDFQEIANLTRTVTEIRRLYTYNSVRAIAIRGTANEITMARWLLAELDKPADAAPRLASDEFAVPGADDVMRVFYVPSAKSVQDFQETANAIRSVTQIRRAFTSNSRRALAVRGTGDQLALAAKLIQDLSTPPQ